MQIETSKKEDVQMELDANVEAQTESWELESGPDSIPSSAGTSWSEGLTNFLSSDGFGDEDQWNDWINERVIFEDFKEQVDDEKQDFADDDRPEDGSIVSRTDSDISDLSNEDEIGAFDVPGLGFLQFHPDDEEEGKSAGSLKPLLVWPLGGGELLFADYQNNTYFTRLLCSSGFGSCQVSIRPHFSTDGEYLHFAALEVRNAEKSADSYGKKPAQVLLTLQVSTHRLSVRETVSSPPLLVLRTNIFIDKTE